MAEAHDIALVLVPIILLLAFGTVALLGSRLVGLSPIVGYLVLGVGIAVISPKLIATSPTISLLAELGVVFLLFDIGLHFSLVQVREQARDIFGFGPVQLIAGTIGLGAAALCFGLGRPAALLVGATLALSSTAVVAGVIRERHQQNCPVGRTATSILIFQDVAAIFLLILATALESGSEIVPAAAVALLKAAIAFVSAVLLARVIVRPLFGFLACTGGEEVFTPVALVVALAAGWAAEAAGLSMTLGAFLGGMALAETPFRAKIRAEINPFRGLLLGFFFIAVGASLDLAVLERSWAVVVALAVLIAVIKVVTNGVASLIFRWSVPGSVQLGFLIAQGSEFAFVLLALPGVRALLGTANVSILGAAVALTLAATGSVAAAGRLLAGRLRAARQIERHRELTALEEVEPVLIVGMGEAGRTVADALRAFRIGYDAVERDPERLHQGIADGYALSFGDASDPSLWHSTYQHGRRYSVLTAPVLEIVGELTPVAEAFYPNVQRIAVTPDAATARQFEAAGLRAIVTRQAPRGLEVARALLEEFGVEPAAAERWSEQQRLRATGSSLAA